MGLLYAQLVVHIWRICRFPRLRQDPCNPSDIPRGQPGRRASSSRVGSEHQTTRSPQRPPPLTGPERHEHHRNHRRVLGRPSSAAVPHPDSNPLRRSKKRNLGGDRHPPTDLVDPSRSHQNRPPPPRPPQRRRRSHLGRSTLAHRRPGTGWVFSGVADARGRGCYWSVSDDFVASPPDPRVPCSCPFGR